MGSAGGEILLDESTLASATEDGVSLELTERLGKWEGRLVVVEKHFEDLTLKINAMHQKALAEAASGNSGERGRMDYACAFVDAPHKDEKFCAAPMEDADVRQKPSSDSVGPEQHYICTETELSPKTEKRVSFDDEFSHKERPRARTLSQWFEDGVPILGRNPRASDGEEEKSSFESSDEEPEHSGSSALHRIHSSVPQKPINSPLPCTSSCMHDNFEKCFQRLDALEITVDKFHLMQSNVESLQPKFTNLERELHDRIEELKHVLTRCIEHIPTPNQTELQLYLQSHRKPCWNPDMDSETSTSMPAIISTRVECHEVQHAATGNTLDLAELTEEELDLDTLARWSPKSRKCDLHGQSRWCDL